MSEIEVETADGVATIWLNRPEKRNAVTYEMWSRIGEVATDLATATDVRVVVVRGRGGHFCAGADIASLGAGDDYAGANKRAEEALAALPKPTIAFLTGSAIGGGAQLAFACDFRIADSTIKCGITPARLGIIYPPHSVERAVRQLGSSAAKHLLFSAELIDGDRAVRIGFVDEVHDPDAAEARLADFTSLLATKRSGLTQQASKAMVDAAVGGPIDPELVRHWNRAFDASADSIEGVAAFLEKRDPNFTWNG